MTDIFIKSYPKDFEFLNYCIESISKYVTGYDNIVLLIPEGTNFEPLNKTENLKIIKVKEEGNGYLFQQYCKLTAFNYSEADNFMFVDSDCLFNRKVNVNSDEFNTILYTSWDKVGDALCWKEPTENFLGIEVQYEFMRRNCMIYKRETLINVCSMQKNIKHYILNQKSFSEFNVLGAFAYYYEQQKYKFQNTDTWEYKEAPFIQFWSWGGLTPDVMDKIKAVL